MHLCFSQGNWIPACFLILFMASISDKLNYIILILCGISKSVSAWWHFQTVHLFYTLAVTLCSQWLRCTGTFIMFWRIIPIFHSMPRLRKPEDTNFPDTFSGFNSSTIGECGFNSCNRRPNCSTFPSNSTGAQRYILCINSPHKRWGSSSKEVTYNVSHPTTQAMCDTTWALSSWEKLVSPPPCPTLWSFPLSHRTHLFFCPHHRNCIVPYNYASSQSLTHQRRRHIITSLARDGSIQLHPSSNANSLEWDITLYIL